MCKKNKLEFEGIEANPVVRHAHPREALDLTDCCLAWQLGRWRQKIRNVPAVQDCVPAMVQLQLIFFVHQSITYRKDNHETERVRSEVWRTALCRSEERMVQAESQAKQVHAKL